jgi:hypothetical protein
VPVCGRACVRVRVCVCVRARVRMGVLWAGCAQVQTVALQSTYIAGGVLTFLSVLCFLGLSSGVTEGLMGDRFGKYLVTLQVRDATTTAYFQLSPRGVAQRRLAHKSISRLVHKSNKSISRLVAGGVAGVAGPAGASARVWRRIAAELSICEQRRAELGRGSREPGRAAAGFVGRTGVRFGQSAGGRVDGKRGRRDGRRG